MNEHMPIALPEQGESPDQILQQIGVLKQEDADWKAGKVWSLVYYADETHDKLLQEAHNALFSTNYLNPLAFKSLHKMEQDVVHMAIDMLHGNDRAVGVMTSGGTESILVAMFSYRTPTDSRDTAFDKFTAGDQAALSDGAKRGWDVFQKAECTTCHRGVLFTDLKFHNVGIGVVDGKPTDVGRFTVTKDPKDTGAFKTPTLRDVGRSAPYFHDGSVWELDKAVSIMGQAQLGKALPEEEVGNIVAFLGTLTGDVPEKVRVLPLLPPSTDPASRPDNGN